MTDLVLWLVIDSYLKQFTWYALSCNIYLENQTDIFVKEILELPKLKLVSKKCKNQVEQWFQREWGHKNWAGMNAIPMDFEFDPSHELNGYQWLFEHFRQFIGWMHNHNSYDNSYHSECRVPGNWRYELDIFETHNDNGSGGTLVLLDVCSTDVDTYYGRYWSDECEMEIDIDMKTARVKYHNWVKYHNCGAKRIYLYLMLDGYQFIDSLPCNWNCGEI